jgi:uncharacterized membrane protein YphA (DoxX/SURF4 family)
MRTSSPHGSLNHHSLSDKLAVVGRFFFGIATTAFGGLQLIRVDFVRLVPDLPTWLPAHAWWAGMTGAILVAIGVSILSGRQTRLAATLLAGLLLFSIVFLHIPEIAADPARGFKWTNPCKALALFGGAILLTAIPAHMNAARDPALVRVAQRLLPFGPALFLGIFFVVAGIQHFVYAAFVTQLVPAWMPVPAFWTYFTGIALIAGGVGLVLKPFTRLASRLSGLMVFLWALLLHLPLALAIPYQRTETDGFFEALALSGVAFMLLSSPGFQSTTVASSERQALAS